MRRTLLLRLRSSIMSGSYDVTVHAVEEMAKENLDIIDVESAILDGTINRIEKGDLRGMRYTIHGLASDGESPIGVVGRFTESGRFLVITVYRLEGSTL